MSNRNEIFADTVTRSNGESPFQNVTGTDAGTKRGMDVNLVGAAEGASTANAHIIYSDYQASLLDTEEIDSGWLDMAGVDKVQFSGYASASGMTMTLESRADDAQTALSTPVTYTDGPFYMFNVICRQRYLRFKWTNNTGSTVTNVSMEIKQTFGSSDKLSVFPVGVNPTVFSQAALVQAITRGQQPDGDYVAVPATGEAFNTESLLGGTRLDGAVSDSATTLTVDDTSDFPSAGTLGINGEFITYTGKTSTTFTGCTRGAEQTTATAHVDNQPVGQAYVSSWFDSDGWDIIDIFIQADQPSKLQGVCIQFTDNSQAVTPEVRGEKKIEFTANDVTKGFESVRALTILDGFRIIYINGPTTQTDFYLSATLRVQGDSSRFNIGGGLITASFDTEVSLGNVNGYQNGTKFGRVKGTDAADSAVDIWAFSDDAASPRANTKTFPTSASVFYFASSSTSDTAVTISVDYIDANGFARNETVSLNGQTPVALSQAALDVNRFFVNSSTSAVGILYAATANNFSSGVPNTASQVVAVAPAGYNQTQLSQFTVPRGKKLIIMSYRVLISRASGAAGSADITLRVKPDGQASRVIREFFPTTSVPVEKDNSSIVIDERSQIVWRVDDVSDNETNISCVWDYELIDI